MKKPFIASLCALSVLRIEGMEPGAMLHNCVFAVNGVSSEEEARALAMAEALRLWPEEQGYSDHCAAVAAITCTRCDGLDALLERVDATLAAYEQQTANTPQPLAMPSHIPVPVLSGAIGQMVKSFGALALRLPLSFSTFPSEPLLNVSDVEER